MEQTSDYRMMSSMCLVIANAMSLESTGAINCKAQPRDEGAYATALYYVKAGTEGQLGSGPERIRSQQLMDWSTSRSPVIHANAIVPGGAANEHVEAIIIEARAQPMPDQPYAMRRRPPPRNRRSRAAAGPGAPPQEEAPSPSEQSGRRNSLWGSPAIAWGMSPGGPILARDDPRNRDDPD